MLNDFFKYLEKYKGVILNKALLADIDKHLKADLNAYFRKQKRVAMLKAENRLKKYYNQRIKQAEKGRLSLKEFDLLNQMKLENKHAKGKKLTIPQMKAKIIADRKRKGLILKEQEKIPNKDLKEYRKAYKNRVAILTKQIKDDPKEAIIYKDIYNTISNRLLPLDKETIQVLKDRTNKKDYSPNRFNLMMENQEATLRASMDTLSAMENDHIGFYWITCLDERVVGNPDGLYPKGNDAHGDHWDRHERAYFYRNSTAIKRGYIDTSKIKYTDEIHDGVPGEAYNCRCIAQPITSLDEVEEEYLTPKGIRRLEKL